MAVEYDLYKVSDIHSKETDLLKARTVSKGTITTHKLASWIQQISGFNHGQSKGLLMCLTDTILDYLEDGYEVQLGELGYFSILVTGRPVKNKKELRAESVRFKRLLFRPSKKTRDRLKNLTVKRVDKPVAKTSSLPQEKRAEILADYLEKQPCITRAEYMHITSASRHKAINDLKSFIQEGWLRKYGAGRTVVYLLEKKE